MCVFVVAVVTCSGAMVTCSGAIQLMLILWSSWFYCIFVFVYKVVPSNDLVRLYAIVVVVVV